MVVIKVKEQLFRSRGKLAQKKNRKQAGKYTHDILLESPMNN